MHERCMHDASVHDASLYNTSVYDGGGGQGNGRGFGHVQWIGQWTWRYCHLASAPEENGRRSLALAGTKGRQLLVGSEAMRLIEDREVNLLIQHGLLIGPFRVA